MDHARHVHHHARHDGPSHAGHGGESLNRIAERRAAQPAAKRLEPASFVDWA